MKFQAHSSLETITGIQLGPDSFDESRFIMTFLTILGIMETLCSFRLVLEGKTVKEIPESSRLEFFEKLLANNFALSGTENNTSGSLNRRGLADLPLSKTLLAICQESWEPSFFCFGSIWKFGNFKNPFAMIASLSELYFRFRRFILLVQNEKSALYEL